MTSRMLADQWATKGLLQEELFEVANHNDLNEHITNNGLQRYDLDRPIEKLEWCEIVKKTEAKALCAEAREILLEKSNVQRVDSLVTVCGDIHGQFCDLKELFEVGSDVPEANYLFMDDFVDRDYYSVETLLLLGLKVRYSDRITLIYGNHESHQINIA